MTKRRVVFLIGIVLVAGAYMAGFWPERQRAQQARADLSTLEARVAELESRVRLGEIFGLLLRLTDAVAARNYGEASEQATVYFDRVAGETAVATTPEVQTVLQDIHQSRDRVVAALARTEPIVFETLREQEYALRRALNYPVPDRLPPSSVALPPSPAEIPAPGDVR
jgi:hypothetical protein